LRALEIRGRGFIKGTDLAYGRSKQNSLKAMKLYGFKSMKILDVPVPKVGPNDVLVKVSACGLCGTDLEHYQGVPTFGGLPLTLGHEISGIVQEVGSATRRIKVGQRVLVPPVLTCGMCYPCRTGRDNLCESMSMIGSSINGGFAEYVRVPSERDIVPLPSDLPLEESAIITDALATPYHALKYIAKVQAGMTVGVFGAGGIGLNAVQLANLFGASVTAITRNPQRLEEAKQLGAIETVTYGPDAARQVRGLNSGGVDVAIEATGRTEVIKTAWDSVRKGGILVVVGVAPGDLTIPNAVRIMFYEKGMFGSFGCRSSGYYELIEILRRKRLKLVVSERISLDNLKDGFTRLEKSQISTRAIVTP
jgi:D-arabinose 1-dehydrogenase-like Zn-dependent alcohol dehydrogenase